MQKKAFRNANTNFGSVTKEIRLSTIMTVTKNMFWLCLVWLATCLYIVVAKTQVLTFGWNAFGQLGDSVIGDKPYPVSVLDRNNVLLGSTITTVAAGYYHSMLLSSDGKVFTFGWNSYGQLGDGTKVQRYYPVPIYNYNNTLTQEKIISISAGFFHSVLLSSNGKVFTFGGNDYGQLGDGSNSHRNYTVPIVDVGKILTGKRM